MYSLESQIKAEQMQKKSDEEQFARDRKPIYFYFIILSGNQEKFYLFIYFFQNDYSLLTKFISGNHGTRYSKSMKSRDELFLTLGLQI